MSGPRILAIMGSGETAPTMAKVHAALLGLLDPGPGSGTIIDTPYGFQENADELTARTLEFFRERVGTPFTVASYRSNEVDATSAATAVARIRAADYVMSGPGSPSYALRHWAGGPIPGTLDAKLASGGIVTMASAAALTVGVVTIPVYEIYKVGEPPHWLEGLDLLGGATGLRAAVVPHFDNAEGGTHDTRFCYLGERRLQVLEHSMPAGSFVLGVDSHTALILDLEAGTASVRGLGGVTVRVAGRSLVFPSGAEAAIEAFAEAARRLAAGDSPTAASGDHAQGGSSPALDRVVGRPGGPVQHEAARLEGSFIAALGAGDLRGAVEALLDLDSAIEGRIRAGEDTPDLDNAHAVFRALITRLGESAQRGVRDPHETVGPFVETLVELRDRARASRDWATADLVRDRLVLAGVEVRDAPDGSTWHLRDGTDR